MLREIYEDVGFPLELSLLHLSWEINLFCFKIKEDNKEKLGICNS